VQLIIHHLFRVLYLKVVILVSPKDHQALKFRRFLTVDWPLKFPLPFNNIGLRILDFIYNNLSKFIIIVVVV